MAERYNKIYVRFLGMNNMTCEFPISTYDAIRVLDRTISISELADIKRKQVNWNPETFYRIGIIEYLTHHIKLYQIQAEMFYKKLYQRFCDRDRFYRLMLLRDNYVT